MSTAPPDIRWIGTFLEALAAERGAAPNTINSYARDLNDFYGFVEAKGHAFETLSRDDIEAYLIRCEAEGLAKSTRARRLSAIRQLYRFAYEEGWRADNPAIRISGPGKATRLPKTLDIDEVEALLEAACDQGRSAPSRSATAVLWNCSMRQGCGCRSWSRCPSRRREAIRRCS